MVEGIRDHPGSETALPERYGDDYLVLMTRDPYCLFAYWEISLSTLKRLPPDGGEITGFPFEMRVFKHYPRQEGEIESFFDLQLTPGSVSWYITVTEPGCSYHAELGRLLPDGSFMTLLHSNIVQTPRDSVSNVIDENWHLPDWKARKLYRRIALSHLSSPELFRWRSLRVQR